MTEGVFDIKSKGKVTQREIISRQEADLEAWLDEEIASCQ